MDGPSLDLAVEVETASGRRHRWDADQLRVDNRPVDMDFRSMRGEGFADAGVTLLRRIDQDWPDLGLIDTVRFVGADGTVAYEGRHIRNPRSISDGHSIHVEVGGWIKHMTDRTFQEIYVDRDVASWGSPTLNQREANAIASNPMDAHFTAEASKAHLKFEGTTDASIPASSRALLMYLMPEVCRAAEFQYRLRQDNAGANYTAPTLYATDDDTVLPGSQDSYTLTPASSVQAQALTTARRYLALMLNRSSTGTPSSPAKRLYTTPAVYGDHGLVRQANAGEPDGFLASDVIEDIVSRFCPKLQTDVTPTDYPISHIAWPESITPYDAIAELGAYHLWELGVWEDRTLRFAPADLSNYDWQVRFDDAGVGIDLQGDSIESLRNGIVVQYEDVKLGGRTLYPADYEELRDDSEGNPANRHGLELWGAPVQIPFPTTEGDALRLGSMALADSNLPKAPGSIKVEGHVKDRQGNLRPGWMVRAGQTIRVTNFPNDRPRLISEASWDQPSKTLSLTVELPSYGLDALFARIANRRTARGLE